MADVKEVIIDRSAVGEYLGLRKAPETMRLSAVATVQKLVITKSESVNPMVVGRWFRAEDVIAMLRLHARQQSDPFLNEIADQLRKHAGLPRSI